MGYHACSIWRISHNSTSRERIVGFDTFRSAGNPTFWQRSPEILVAMALYLHIASKYFWLRVFSKCWPERSSGRVSLDTCIFCFSLTEECTDVELLMSRGYNVFLIVTHVATQQMNAPTRMI